MKIKQTLNYFSKLKNRKNLVFFVSAFLLYLALNIDIIRTVVHTNIKYEVHFCFEASTLTTVQGTLGKN